MNNKKKLKPSNRREFLSQFGLATGSIMLSCSNVFAIPFVDSDKKIDESEWVVQADGTYTLLAGNIQLKNCYPSIDGKPIHPISLEVLKTAEIITIKYKLSMGTFIIKLSKSDSKYIVSSSIEGIEKAPHWIQPLASAEVYGADRFCKQGLGFAGPSGFNNINSSPLAPPKRTEAGNDETWFLESYMVSGFIAPDQNTVTIAAYDHRNYLQKSILSERQERSGLINRHLSEETLLFQAGFSTEGITVANNTLILPDLYIEISTVPFEGFRKTSKSIAKEMKVRPPQESRYHWCSWYIKEEKYSHSDLQKFLSLLKKSKPSIPLQTIQIDDGYAHRGDWLEPLPTWPDGVKKPFEEIIKSGYKAGVWIGPFMVQKFTKLAKEHPDWLLKDLEGKPVIEGDQYILDSSHPEAFNYLRNVFRTFKSMGCSLYKTDFMDWGLKDSLNVKRHTPGKTSVQYFREVLTMIREEIGEESYWLGCIAPFAPFLGFADGMRVSNDSNKSWGSKNYDNLFQEMSAGHYFNQVFWHNDPDVVFLSKEECSLSDNEIQTLAYFSGILATSVNNSGLFNNQSSINLWRFLIPPAQPEPAIFFNWGKDQKHQVVIRYYKDLKSYGILFSNISAVAINETYSIKALINEPDIFMFEWSHVSSKGLGKISTVEVSLQSHESRLYFLNKVNTKPSSNLTIGGKMLV